MKLTDHFDSHELECHCGCGKAEMDAFFMEKLEKARILATIPFHITSGYRCETYNASRAVGGVDSSAHTAGKAADVAATGSQKRFLIVKAALEAGITRIGINALRGFIHLDTDESKAASVIWLYPSPVSRV